MFKKISRFAKFATIREVQFFDQGTHEIKLDLSSDRL